VSSLGVLGGGARHDPIANAWSPMSALNRPTSRSRPSLRSGWVGDPAGRALVFGGASGNVVKKDGKHYDPVADGWSSGVGAMLDHRGGAGIWSGVELILWSGRDGSSFDAKGERYRP